MRRKRPSRFPPPRQETHRQNRHTDGVEANTEAAQLKEQLEHAESRRHGPQACALAPIGRWSGGGTQWL